MSIKVERDRIAEAFAGKDLITEALAKGVRDEALLLSAKLRSCKSQLS
jgi:hypothetical protein